MKPVKRGTVRLPKAEQDALCRHYTEDVDAARIAAALDIPRHMSVMDPHAGKGAFIRAFLARGHPVAGMDVDPEATALAVPEYRCVMGDFLIDEPPIRPDWIVGNPPFTNAPPHIVRAIGLARLGVAFVLPIRYLSSRKREDLWAEHPLSALWIFADRLHYSGSKTTAPDDYALFVWRKNQRGGCLLYHSVPGAPDRKRKRRTVLRGMTG